MASQLLESPREKGAFISFPQGKPAMGLLDSPPDILLAHIGLPRLRQGLRPGDGDYQFHPSPPLLLPSPSLTAQPESPQCWL